MSAGPPLTRLSIEECIASTPCGLLIGDIWSASSTGRVFAVEDPADHSILTSVADASPEDALRALNAADDAFAGWSATAPRIRSETLMRCFDALRSDGDAFARLISLEMGKPLAEARGEVAYGAEFFRWFAEEAVRIGGRYTTSPAGNGTITVQHEPVGPVLAITPWNFPLAMAARKIAPALAAGCTVVLKPAPETPLTALRLGALLLRCGVPPGAFNVIPTSEPAPITELLTRDPRLRKITFTGSTAVGRLLVRSSADRLLRTSMELGGNAPFLVFADCDLPAALDGAVLAKMRNMGEACTAANRFYVESGIAPSFADGLATRMSSMTVGRGVADGVQVGPLISEKQRRTTHALVQDAVSLGATVLTGGGPLPGPGWFYAPTVLTDVPPTARILKEEVFGPVAPIVTFDREEQAVAAANDTAYGLAAYVYTSNLARARRVADALRTGMVGINRGLISDVAAPFGGVGASGFGREGGAEGIFEYLQTKYIAHPR